MSGERFIAFVLIGVGLLALVSNLAGGALWLWFGALAGLLLYGYTRQNNYGFLVVGGAFAGLTIGSLIGTVSGLLISLGVGFFVVDRLEPKASRWPLYLSGALILSGLIIGLINSGILGSFWFALLLIAAGLFMLLRNRERRAGTDGDGWVRVEPPRTQPVRQTEVSASPPPEQTKPAADPAQTSQTEPAFASEDIFGDAAAARYERLEHWRRDQAKEEDRAAYLIFTNETLRLIAEKKPKTPDELADIKGIGPVKLERYGEQVLKLLGETP